MSSQSSRSVTHPPTPPRVPPSHLDIELTAEQSAVVTAVAEESHNAIVNAVAGSGKTRTALATAAEWLHNQSSDESRQPVLLVTYNKRLQREMASQRDQWVARSLRRLIDVSTIHSVGHRYFGGQGLTDDDDLARWTSTHATPIDLPPFGLVIIDEAQDLTSVLFEFIHFVIGMLDRPRLLIIGDPFQMIYRFKGADERYLLQADEKFGDVVADAPFESFRMSVCFRISHEMASWINTHLNPNNLFRAYGAGRGWFEQHEADIARLWGRGIRANPRLPAQPGSVIYYRRNGKFWDSAAEEVAALAVEEMFTESDVTSSAILASSVRRHVTNSPVMLIIDWVSRILDVSQEELFGDGDADLRSDPGRGYIPLASTIHSFKGCERDAIVLVGVDDFVENLNADRGDDPRDVFNMFYVGATRAKKYLLIVQWSDTPYATHTSR